MEGIDDDFGGLIRRERRQELSPDPVPGLTGEDVVRSWARRRARELRRRLSIT